MEKEIVIIAGRVYQLNKCDAAFVKKLPVDIRLRFTPYLLDFNGDEMMVLDLKKDTFLTPSVAHKLCLDLEKTIEKPVVFLFKKLTYYERDRYIRLNVYFLVSRKYAFLPYLLINAKAPATPLSRMLNAKAQHILLHHLQVAKLDGMTIDKLEEIFPYKYVILTRAIKVLEDLELCFSMINDEHKKVIHFTMQGRELWERALPYTINPITRTTFAESIKDANLIVSGINALAHYNRKAKISRTTYAIFQKEAKNVKLEHQNPLDGGIKIEVWSYPPLAQDGFVDPLSLYLTLKEDPDTTEKELDTMIEKLWTKKIK